ncbi:MAG: tRNA preQ1(34) S-adenosylmethionine ribosyltransferase-isomerase QueA [Desulfobacterales bacterium]|jgi:S-adenosylmethionine:tRNA ribosyltransferase-isomerase|nr:tRNA preQ1(34) S-adenosylmethionine ribosyltransferase-isomerase QueA [Desulfobacterales bacterium]
MYQLEDYHYALPESLIAQQPVSRREHSRLMVLQRPSGQITHHPFTDIGRFLSPGDALVINNTAVVPARLSGNKETGGKVELLIIDYADGIEQQIAAGMLRFKCLIRAAKRPQPGAIIDLDPALRAEVVDFEDGIFTVDFCFDGDFEAILYRIGKVPLPPYIKRAGNTLNTQDVISYQTVYAAEKGAAAAPTAGLHFSTQLLRTIKENDVHVVPITLHVGYGTFVPVRVSDIREHRMHSEAFVISEDSADIINRVKASGNRVVGVGTTSVRTLEYAADRNGVVHPGSGRSDLFIYPGYRFKIVDAMITNFHLPESTLLMLVAAFAGREKALAAYAEAVEKKYRFFSYGDAMYIE